MAWDLCVWLGVQREGQPTSCLHPVFGGTHICTDCCQLQGTKPPAPGNSIKHDAFNVFLLFVADQIAQTNVSLAFTARLRSSSAL
jgi:hypothetical protein